jgi:hypothetical protein
MFSLLRTKHLRSKLRERVSCRWCGTRLSRYSVCIISIRPHQFAIGGHDVIADSGPVGAVLKPCGNTAQRSFDHQVTRIGEVGGASV